MTTSFENPSANPAAPGRRWGRVLFVLALLATLVAAFYGIENWRGRRAWAAYQKEAAAQGFHTDWAYYAPKPVPEEENFAATPFLKAVGYRGRVDTNVWGQFTEASKGIRNGGDWQLGRVFDLQRSMDAPNNPPAPATHTADSAARDCLAILAAVEPQLEELRAASRRPYAQFATPVELDPDATVPNYVAIRRIGQVLETSAAAHLRVGETEPAFADILAIQRLADALEQQAYLVSAMIRVAVLQGLVMQPFWEGWVRRQWTDQQLVEFQRRFAAVNVVADVDRSMRAGEMVSVSQLVIKHRNSLGGIFASSQRAGQGSGNTRSAREWVEQRLYATVPAGWVYQNLVTHNRCMMKMLSAINPELTTVSPRRLEDFGRELEALARRRHPYTWLASIGIPNFVRAELTTARCQTAMQQAALACVLERYRRAEGRYPGKLDELVPRFAERLPKDVCTGEPLHYRVKDDGTFLLYAVGWNTTDDGGKVAMKPALPDQVDLEHGDWVWPTAITGEQ